MNHVLARWTAALLVLLVANTAFAQRPPDEPTTAGEGSARPEPPMPDLDVPYSVANEGWQGTTSLAALGQWAGIPVVDAANPAVEVGPGDVLWFLYPTNPPDVDAIARWVQAGNSVVIADDFGQGDVFAEAFGVTRTPIEPLHGSFEQDLPGLPRLLPVGEHPLSSDVAEIVANHAVVLEADGRPVFAWEDGSGLVWDVRLGTGRAVFVGDPSIFINLMLPVRDNRQFAVNLMRHTCGEACRVVIVHGDTPVEIPRPDATGWTGRVPELQEWLKRWLQALQHFVLPDDALRMLGVLLAAGAALVWLTIFPRFRERLRGLRLGDWPVNARATYESELSRYAGALGETSFIRPASLLRVVFVPLFSAGCSAARVSDMDLDADVRPELLATRWIDRFEPQLRGYARWARLRELSWLFRTFRGLPTGPVLPATTEPMTRAQFYRLYETARSVLHRMGQDDEFRRRTESP